VSYPFLPVTQHGRKVVEESITSGG